MEGRVEQQDERARIAALEDALERTRLRRFGVPLALGLALALAGPMWDAMVPGPLTSGNLVWMTVCGIAALTGLAANERSCRRRIRTMRTELAADSWPWTRLQQDPDGSEGGAS